MRFANTRLALPLFIALLTAGPLGCVPPIDDPDVGVPPDTGMVVIPLGDAFTFGEGITDGLGVTGVFEFSDQLPEGDPLGAGLLFDAADITVGPPSGSTDIPDAKVTLLVQINVVDGTDPCEALVQLLFFDITVTDGVITNITPTASTLDSDGFDVVRSGALALCVIATATAELTVSIDALGVDFIMPDEVTAHSCADILALPEVQSAVADLDSNGIEFTLPTGAAAPNIVGAYDLETEITFDPDGENIGDTQTAEITQSDQTVTAITRSGLNASIRQFIRGDAESVALCTLQRTGLTRCDQTIARLESLSLDSATGDLTGNFLSVAVRRHASTGETCGAAGDFIYGTLALTALDHVPTLINQRGKVELAEGFEPGLIVLPPGDGPGTVTDIGSDAAIHFATSAPFTTTAIPLPADLDATGFSALGISADGSRLAVITNTPDAAFVFANDGLAAIRATSTTTRDFLGESIPFNLDNTQLYLPTTDDSATDHITVLRADDSDFTDEVRRITTPQGAIPVQIRLNPAGTQLAVLLEGGAALGEAAALSFINLSDNRFVLPTIDLTTDAGGSALASELVYSANGQFVFLAGLGAVLAVQTESPYAITRIDVSAGANDNPVSLALSNDGKVLAVAIDDSTGTADFAVIDTATLQVVNAQDLPGIGDGRALGVAHFQNGRVAMVANLDATVVAVQTEPPYAAGDPIRIVEVTGLDTLGRIVSGGDVIAVTNMEEPAIYIFELAE